MMVTGAVVAGTLAVVIIGIIIDRMAASSENAGGR